MFNKLIIRGRKIKIPIFQGGMGIGISMAPLASAVTRAGGVGTLSSAAIDRVVSARLGKKFNTYDAIIEEIRLAKKMCNNGIIAINIMVALQKDYETSVKASIDGGIDFIVSGGGLPTNLPRFVGNADVALIPVVSSVRALDIIVKKWSKFNYRPDAVILEGPLAGGHLGFGFNDISSEENRLENLFPAVKEYAQKNGDFPVVVAGGISTHDDILKWYKIGADGVQLATRFLMTNESDANLWFKQAVINSVKEDIIIVDPKHMQPGSPCGLPFRILRDSPMYQLGATRKSLCNKGYVLQKNKDGKFIKCLAKDDPNCAFCICNGLCSSAGCEDNEQPLWTVGARAHEIDKIISVAELMDELTGQKK